MTTPASNIDSTQTATYRFRYVLSWAPGNRFTNYSTQPVAQQRSIRPQSVNNPLRPDGTRAPSAWSNRWLTMQVPFGRPNWVQDGGSGTTISYFTEGAIPVVRSFTGNDVFAGVGAHWCRAGLGDLFPPEVENLARTRVLNKVSQSKAQFGSALTEFKGAVDTVTTTAEVVAQSIKQIAKGVRTSPELVSQFLRDPKSTIRSLNSGMAEEITDLWLLRQYGLRPLLSDIEDAGTALDRAIFERGQSFNLVVRGGYLNKARRSVTFHGDTNPSYEGTFDVEVSSGCFFSAVYMIPFTSGVRYQQLGLNNVPAAWWEAVRFSWAVDHVANVGTWLNSLMAIDGVFFVEGSRSRIQRVAKPGVFRYRRDSTILTLSGLDPVAPSFDGGRFERTVLNQAGIMPAFMPSLKPRLGVEFMSNALSVLSQLAALRSGRRFI